MRSLKLLAPIVLLVFVLPAAAQTAPLCTSSVPVSGSASMQLGEFNSHGFGGGFIGAIQLPAITGVTPTPTATEGDVVAALTSLNFLGVLGGGTSQIRPIQGLGGSTTTLTGAQDVAALLFTGHFKAIPKTYDCESVVHQGATVHWSYFDITISGLLTPTTGGSPLAPFAQGYQIAIAAGDNSPS